GFTISLYIHIAALVGKQVVPEEFMWIMQIGAVIVFGPAIVLAQKKYGSPSRRDFWKVMLRDSPSWMRYFAYCLFAYELVNIALFWAKGFLEQGQSTSPVWTWRELSAAWIGCYFLSLAVLYPAAVQMSRWRCVNGHPVFPGASVCDHCGQPVLHR